jgi:PadR family transcriptional regulator, regulatory protein AphA
MPKSELSLFSYEILGLIGTGGAGAHDLRRMVQRGRAFAWAGESQYYVEPKRLAALGYLEARKEPGKTRRRTVYFLTEKGLRALREWAETSVYFTPVKSEMLIRMLICDLVGEEVTRQGIASLREDIADIERRTDEAEANVSTLAHREKYLLLNLRYLRGLIRLHLDWIEDAERALSGR